MHLVSDSFGHDGKIPHWQSGRSFHLVFRLYALDEPLEVAAGVTKDELLAEIRDHILKESGIAASYDGPPVMSDLPVLKIREIYATALTRLHLDEEET